MIELDRLTFLARCSLGLVHAFGHRIHRQVLHGKVVCLACEFTCQYESLDHAP